MTDETTPLCGKSWCTIQHATTDKRRRAECEHTVWVQRGQFWPLRMSLRPHGSRIGGATVVTDLLGLRGAWYIGRDRDWQRCSAYVSADEARILAAALLEAADAADRMHELVLVEGPDLEVTR